jgi:hypothetical protein
MKVAIPVNVDTILKQLPMREKIRLVRQLEQETWATRLDEVVNRIRVRSSARQLSSQEITRIVDDVRRARYARASRRP